MRLLDPFEVDFSGVHLIEASAGTGKTYNISSLYIRAVAEQDYSVDEILVVTYTEAATKELKDRLMRRLRESVQVLEGAPAGDDTFLATLESKIENRQQAIEQLKKAIHSFDEAAVYTIHGFCHHALQERAFISGASFDAELIGDDSEIVVEIVDDYWRSWVKEATESTLKRPLLKLLLDKGYTPDKLANELARFTGKPYQEAVPEEVSPDEYYEAIDQINALFNDLKKIWKQEKEAIYNLLRSDQIHGSKYRKDYLAGWMEQADAMFAEDVAPITFFDMFHKFSQSTINESLKKSASEPPPEHDFFASADLYIAKTDFLKSFDVAFKRRLFDHILTKLPSRKEELQVLSFDDLLVRLRDALHRPEQGDALCNDLRETYPIALVDEFQDTDPVQYDIFRAIYAGQHQTALFMIGDPKQSIYSFRGADVFAYLQAKKDAAAGKTFSLGHNYRSVPSLIDGVNALFTFQDHPFVLENIGYEPVRPGRVQSEQLFINGKEEVPLEIRRLVTGAEESEIGKTEAKNRSAEDTARRIKKLLIDAANGKAVIGDCAVQAKDIAVLVRSHYQASLISEALRDLGIKSVTHSRESVFHSDEAHQLYRVLKAVVEPANEHLVVAALSSRMFGYTANELLSLKEDERGWADKLNQFSEWNTMWQASGFPYMFRKMMQGEQIAETVIGQKEGERALTNLIHLSGLIAQKEEEERAGMHTILKWLLKKGNEANKEVEEEQLRLESDENLVSVVTMHHSKGLEYPIVFCPFLWDAPQNRDDGSPIVYHDRGDVSKVYLDLHGKDDPERSKKRYLQAKEELAESVRLAYVAITRAKYKCVINWVHAKNSVHSPLGLLMLGSEESFASLKASVDKDLSYDPDTRSLNNEAFDRFKNEEHILYTIAADGEEGSGVLKSDNGALKLESETFQRRVPLPDGPGMASFSSLIRNEQDDFEDDLLAYYDEPNRSDSEEGERLSERTVFDFPKGPGPGTVVHHIFENIAFDDHREWNPVIEEQLGRQDIDLRWLPVVKQMVRATVEKPLLKSQPDLRLSHIDPRDMIAEMEFYFTTGDVRLSDILDIIRPDDESLPSLEGFAEEGFLKGFIDLIFQHSEQYYLLDYKTNYLGDAVSDYEKPKLKHEIKEALYDVQYHLYSIALHRYLKNRNKNYRYENHFGGAFYLFVRGINDHGSEGVFFDRPEPGVINQLNAYLERKL